MATNVENLRDIPISSRSSRLVTRVDRSTEMGNAFNMRADKDRDWACDRYEEYFNKRIETDPAFKREVLSLKGKTLFCWCAPKRCHADTIASWLNGQGD